MAKGKRTTTVEEDLKALREDDVNQRIQPEDVIQIIPDAQPLPIAPDASHSVASIEPTEFVAEVSLPLCEELSKQFQIHIDTDIPPAEATKLRRIAIALQRRGARLANGTPVKTPTHALLYLLERMKV
jgi:hypothetical protein